MARLTNAAGAGWRARLFVSLAALAAFMGCASRATPCSFENCADGTRCDYDGVCRPLPTASPLDTAFRISRHLVATDWASVARGGESERTDAMSLGGDLGSDLYLAFLIPESARSREIEHATLVLFAHPSFVGATEAATIAVSRTTSFDGAELHRRLAGQGAALSARTLTPPRQNAMRFDVSEAVARAAESDAVYLRVRMARGGDAHPWRFASPDFGDPSRHPRLELMLR